MCQQESCGGLPVFQFPQDDAQKDFATGQAGPRARHDKAAKTELYRHPGSTKPQRLPKVVGGQVDFAHEIISSIPSYRRTLMSVDESVSVWIEALKEGDSEAVQRLWKRYFKRLVGLARNILRTTPKRMSDEEDVALSAFMSFCDRASRGKFPRLEDRHDLWKILMTITVRKAIRIRRKERRGPKMEEVDFVKVRVTGRSDPGVCRVDTGRASSVV
jgi:hypothetical protein